MLMNSFRFTERESNLSEEEKNNKNTFKLS